MDSINAKNGVMVSLTPRIIAVSSRKTSSDGSAIIITRAYAVASVRMSAGVFSASSTEPARNQPETPTSRPPASVTVSVVPATILTFSGSFAPHACPIRTEEPAPSPTMNEMKKNTIGNITDTAASACTPIIWPR